MPYQSVAQVRPGAAGAAVHNSRAPPTAECLARGAVSRSPDNLAMSEGVRGSPAAAGAQAPQMTALQ